MPRAEWAFIGDLVISYPPEEAEQWRILSALRCETAGLNEAMTRAQRQIDLIREYRTRLIADVVTGKLDVRHVAPESPASVDGQAWLGEVEAALADEMAEGEGGRRSADRTRRRGAWYRNNVVVRL